MPAALFDDAVYRRKTQARAPAAFLCCIERLENMRQRVRADPHSGIGHAEHHILPRFDRGLIVGKRTVELDVFCFNPQLAPVGHRVARIHDQIQDDLFDLTGISFHGAQILFHPRSHLDRLAHQAPHHLVHAQDDRVQVEQLGF